MKLSNTESQGVYIHVAEMSMKLYRWLALRPRMTVACVMGIAVLVVWAPYIGDMSVLTRYFDGPHYMYIAKTFYDVPDIHPFIPYRLPSTYFSSHLPAYPLMIRMFTYLTFGSYPAAMLMATFVCSVTAAVLFYQLLVDSKLVVSPFYTALLFCFLPPRWMIYHSVGASEPMFYCFVFGAFIAYQRQCMWGMILCIALASVTRITGVLMVPAFALCFMWERDWKQLMLIPLAGLGLFGLFSLYAVQYSDFWIYFHWNQTSLSMFSLVPFRSLYYASVAGEMGYAEILLATYLLYGIGTLRLIAHRALFMYCLVFYFFYTLIHANDLVRFYLSIAPFALLVGYDDLLRRWPTRVVLSLVIVLTFVYAWCYLPSNLVDPRVYQLLITALEAS